MEKIYISYSKYFFLSVVKLALTAFFFLTYNSVSAQDFTNITWETAKNQPIATHEVHGEVVNGKLYIFGGYDYNKRPAYTPTKRAYVYDPGTNTWSTIADLPYTPNGAGFGGVTHEGLTTDGTDIYFAGGYTSNSDGTGQLFGTRQAWKYNVSSNTYTQLPDLPEALAAGQMRYVNGKLHYVGGADSSRADVGVHYALDLNNLSAGWKALSPLINPVNHPGSAVYQGKLYVVGGAHHQDQNTVTQKTLEVYNPDTDTWTALSDMSVGRDHISSAVTVMGDRIIVLGGETSHNVLSKLVSAYTPATDTWTELSPLPTGKSAGVAGVLNGNIYYTGGNFSVILYKGIPDVVLSSQSGSTPVVDSSLIPGTGIKKPVLYPNPFKTKFNIKFPVSYSGNFIFMLSDQTGKTYNIGKRRIERGGTNISLDISKFLLPAGAYFLKIKSYLTNDELKLMIK